MTFDAEEGYGFESYAARRRMIRTENKSRKRDRETDRMK
ncbi:hypothetical protein CCACVL1_26594 [Corchorus capsularis]|uniref:Uncharacterized protein n=1 Tax=Corchorus capsularis TaxID=210143 RepID=A0A1R3GE84_COCAP|nr:hypothetical protein CCACVL1_26594 [Corchorus capsularis]